MIENDVDLRSNCDCEEDYYNEPSGGFWCHLPINKSTR